MRDDAWLLFPSNYQMVAYGIDTTRAFVSLLWFTICETRGQDFLFNLGGYLWNTRVLLFF